MRGMEGPLEVLLAGLAIGGIVGGCAGVKLAGGLGDDDPLGSSKADCIEAWEVQNDGDDDTQNETAILEQPWCDQYLRTVTTMTTTEATP